MSRFAYKDKNRTIKVNASQCHKENINTRFYCPNP